MEIKIGDGTIEKFFVGDWGMVSRRIRTPFSDPELPGKKWSDTYGEMPMESVTGPRLGWKLEAFEWHELTHYPEVDPALREMA